ncbi:hypothetical protein [Paracoccus sp. ME4]|uniref:hypothetical protein n=1 Tax=Paracoccus sp. ME4 TaxID=3138066 RepID=UPI00398B8BDA
MFPNVGGFPVSYVLIYGGIRLDLDDDVMRELDLRPGQHVPNDRVADCLRVSARMLFDKGALLPLDDSTSTLATWAGHDPEAVGKPNPDS